jgi:hypothetical protein
MTRHFRYGTPARDLAALRRAERDRRVHRPAAGETSRNAGLRDVQASVLVHGFWLGHPGRTVALDFVENVADRIVEQGFVGRDELAELKVLLKRQLDDPDTVTISPLFVQAWGRKSSCTTVERPR